MKKSVSIILSILLVMFSCFSPAFAGEEADELVINELGSATLSNTSLDTAVTLDGSPTAKWLTKGTGGWPSVTINADLSAYDYLNVQLYSPKATDDTIGISFRTTKNFTASPTLIDWEGWKTLQIPLSAYAGLKEAGVITYFDLWDQGWNYTYGDAIAGSDKNGSLNIGRIWLSKVDEYVIREGSISPSRGVTCSMDNELTYDGDTTMKWSTKGAESQIVYNIYGDVSSYSTFNAQIYSPEATDDTIGIHFHTSKPYATKTIVVDWEGWKTLQLPMSDFAGINLAEVVTFQMWDHGWNYTFGDAVSGSDKAGSLNIGKIWLDNSEIETPGEPDTPPSEPDEPVVPDEPEDEETEGEYIVAKYDSNFSFGGKLSKDTENVYEQDASAKWDVRTGNNFGYNVLDCDFNDYAFVYATVYSPKSTGSVIMFQYLFEGTGYAVSNIPLNFEGWRTLAFPISDLGIGLNKVKRFNVYCNGWNNKIEGIEYVNFERIWLSKYDISKCEIIEESLVDGYNRVSPVGFEAFVKTTTKLDTESAPEVTLKSVSGKAFETSYEIKGSKLTVKATEDLDYSESYILSIDNITDKNGNSCSYSADFSTHSKAVTALTPELAEDSGKITAVSTATNPTSGDEDALIWICEYSEDGELVNSLCETVSVESGKDAELKAELTMKSSENKVEAFVTDKEGRPIAPFVAVYGEESYEITPSVGGENELSIDSESILTSGFKAEVSLKSKFALPVVAYIRNALGEAVYAKAVMTDSNGKVSFDIPLSSENLPSGKYTFEVYSESSGENPAVEFYFANADDRKNAFNDITKAGSIEKIADEIAEKCEMFNYSVELIETDKTAQFLAEVVDANEVSDFEALAELMDTALDLRNKINTCDWNKLADIIEANYDVLLCSDLKPEFEKLTSDQKAKVAKKLKEHCPYELFSDFASDLEEFIDDVKSEKKQQSSGGGGGGGSSGGSSYSVPVAPFGANAPSDTMAENALPFNDLASASWAQDCIVELYNAGVISPSADGKFRPEDTVTREEFAKLICAAFELEDSSASCSFADVYPDAWYYTYIASMNSKGIITGYGETFGTGNNITREDMAVIAMRALRHMGISLDSGVYASFADEADVSSYAVDAVYALKNAGIINGMGNGSFAPKSNATRAQAAKIISGLMELTAKEAAYNG